jgi:hypothetical protein
MSRGVTVFNVYWDPQGAFASAPGFEDGVDGYVQDVAHDSGTTGNVFSVPTEYTDAGGHHIVYGISFGGRIVDTDPYPTFGPRCAINDGQPCVNDPQIQAELLRLSARLQLPHGVQAIYNVLLPPRVSQCFSTLEFFDQFGDNTCFGTPDGNPFGSYCAYHGNVQPATPQAPPPARDLVIYTVLPYVEPGDFGCDEAPEVGVQYPTNHGGESALTSLTHELLESITDPAVALAPPDNELGWYSAAEGEIADACALTMPTFIGSTDRGPFDQLINGHPYLVQPVWSNRADDCAARASDVGTARPARTQAQASHPAPWQPGVMMSRRWYDMPASARDQARALSSPSPRSSRTSTVTTALAAPAAGAPGVLAAPGLAENDSSYRAGFFFAPQAGGAAGPSSYLEVTQPAVALYDRHLATRRVASLADLAGLPQQSGVAFPRSAATSWDPAAQRFEYMMLVDGNVSNGPVQRAADPPALLYGFSRTANPTGFGDDQWCHYDVSTDALGKPGGAPNAFAEARLGHYDGHMVVAGLLFQPVNGTVQGTSIGIAPTPRPGPLASCPDAPMTFTGTVQHPLRSGDATPALALGQPTPVEATGPMPTGYVVSADDPDRTGLPVATRIHVWMLTADGHVVPQPAINVAPFAVPDNAPQPGSPNKILTWDSSFGQAVAHTWPDGHVSIFAAHPTSDAPGQVAKLRWYELDPTKRLPVQAGTIAQPGSFLFDPAIAPDSSGRNLVITYVESGAVLPRVLVAVHQQSMAPGATGMPTVVAASTSPDQDATCDSADGFDCFFGFYGRAATDPLGGGVWITNEYIGPPDPLPWFLGLDWRTVNAFIPTPSS